MCYLKILFLVFLFIPFSVLAETPSALPDTSTNESVYSLITMPSIDRNKAASALKRIRLTVPDAELREIIKETDIYRLQVECFDNRASAIKLQTILSKKCRTPFIVPGEHSYCVVAGSQMDYNSALADQKLYSKKHISTSIVKLTLPMKQWQVVIGNYPDLKKSVYRADSLSKRGLITTINSLDTSTNIKSKKTLNRLISEEMANSLK